MTTKLMINASLALAGALLLAGVARAEKPAWCTNGVLVESRSFSDRGEAANYVNAHGGTATINGATHIILGTVDVVQAQVGNVVYMVQIWDCPKDPPDAGKDKDKDKDKDKEKDKEKEKVTYTLDPHPELDRHGKKK